MNKSRKDFFRKGRYYVKYTLDERETTYATYYDYIHFLNRIVDYVKEKKIPPTIALTMTSNKSLGQ